jgi:hypothetical protein
VTVEQADLVAGQVGQAQVVGGHDDRRPAGPQAGEGGQQQVLGEGVDPVERLVEQQQPRLLGDRPGQQHPLALPAREGAEPGRGPFGQAEVGLAERVASRFGTLSGGQRQRVLLARAIAQEPRLLLLDEPFNGVDALSQDLLLAALARLRAGGAAVVMATHDLGLAHLACDEVCLLNRHQIGCGPIGTTLTPELLRATYGGQALQLRGDGVIVARP